MATVKLGDIAIEAKSSNKGDKTGIKIVGLEHLTPSNVTLSSWSDDAENSFTKEFSKGDVLFGRRRAYLKKAAVASFDGICSGDITVIRAIEGKVDPELLPFIIQNDYLFDFAVGKSAGSLSPRVKWTHLKEFTIELPSMSEQSKLAETLWSINETKNAYEDLINKTDELVKSQFIEMFGDLYNAGGKWDSYSFVDAIEDISRKGTKIPKEEYLESGEYPVIDQGQDFIAGYTDKNEGMILESETIVFGDHTRCFKYMDFPYFMGADGVKVLKAKIDDLDYKFLLQELKLMPIPNMGYNRHFRWLKEFKVYVPPIHLQKKYAEFIEQSDKSKFALQEAIKDLDALSKKIIAENLIPAGKE